MPLMVEGLKGRSACLKPRRYGIGGRHGVPANSAWHAARNLWPRIVISFNRPLAATRTAVARKSWGKISQTEIALGLQAR